jgi:hypothetical protein
MKPDIGRRDAIKGSCGRLLPRGPVWPAADPKKCSAVVNKAHTVFDRHLGGNLTTWLSLNPLKTIGAGDNRQPIFCADGGQIVPLYPAPESSPGRTQKFRRRRRVNKSVNCQPENGRYRCPHGATCPPAAGGPFRGPNGQLLYGTIAVLYTAATSFEYSRQFARVSKAGSM